MGRRFEDPEGAFEERVASKGGILLSQWQGVDHPVEVQCEFGHVFTCVARTILYGQTWCRKCANRRSALTLADAQEAAVRWNGLCLSDVYVNVREPLVWQCEEGHVFEKPLFEVRTKGNFCPECDTSSRKPEWTFDMALAIAKRDGGKHTGNASALWEKTRWLCKAGHELLQTGRSIVKRGYLCLHCSGRRVTIERVQALAEERGGRCLSTVYKNNRDNLLFECSEGHTWLACWANVRQKTWCPICARSEKGQAKTALETVRQIAIEKGGYLLTTCLRKRLQRFHWRCGQGHDFEATAAEAKEHWCEACPGGSS